MMCRLMESIYHVDDGKAGVAEPGLPQTGKVLYLAGSSCPGNTTRSLNWNNFHRAFEVLLSIGRIVYRLIWEVESNS